MRLSARRCAAKLYLESMYYLPTYLRYLLILHARKTLDPFSGQERSDVVTMGLLTSGDPQAKRQIAR